MSCSYRRSSVSDSTTEPSRGAYQAVRTPVSSSPCKWHSTLNMLDLIIYWLCTMLVMALLALTIICTGHGTRTECEILSYGMLI